VIPSTALGLVIFLAALGPGYIYIRVAERRRPRVERSGLLEAVELVGNAAGLVSIAGFARGPEAYFRAHSVLLIGLGASVLVLGYVVAYAWAAIVYRKQTVSVKPASTSWYDAFWDDRPSRDHLVVVNVELRDRRRITGVLRSFTIGLEDNREIELVAPIAIKADAKARPSTLRDTFLLVREADVLAITGRYVAGRSTQSEGAGPLAKLSDRLHGVGKEAPQSTGQDR
jgi:Family of unknown function (DUF6338)